MNEQNPDFDAGNYGYRNSLAMLQRKQDTFDFQIIQTTSGEYRLLSCDKSIHRVPVFASNGRNSSLFFYLTEKILDKDVEENGSYPGRNGDGLE